MRGRLHIGVSLPFAMALGRGILAGVREYTIGQPRWRLEVSDVAQPPPAGAPLSGMIGFLASENWMEAAGRCGAAVNVSNRLQMSPFPRVVSDDGAVGRMAAEHLLHHGFRRFAFAGSVETMFGRQRYEGFRAALAGVGHGCLALTSNEGVPRRIKRIEKPCAVFAVNDRRARNLIQRLIDRGMRVPEDVAVLGVDDDPLESLISPVAISSVVLDGAGIGYEAARLLDRLLAGEPAPDEPVKIAPLPVASRRSTSRFAADHPAVEKALQVMQTQSARLATVEDVAQAAGLGRRTLERLFRAEIGVPIYQELCRAKLEAVMPAIVRGTEPMFELAARAGFTDASLFNNVCRRIHGKTPGQLRREAGRSGTR